MSRQSSTVGLFLVALSLYFLVHSDRSDTAAEPAMLPSPLEHMDKELKVVPLDTPSAPKGKHI